MLQILEKYLKKMGFLSSEALHVIEAKLVFEDRAKFMQILAFENGLWQYHESYAKQRRKLIGEDPVIVSPGAVKLEKGDTIY